MTEPTPPTERPDAFVCPWCSAAVTPETVTCPSCKAVLMADEEPNLPGVTAVDLKVMRGEKPPQRSRLLSWLSGEYPDEVPTETNAQAIAPPDPDVQREIRRLEYEAEVANLQAEADAMLSEAVAEGRIVIPDEVEEGAEDGMPAQDTMPASADASSADASSADASSADAAAADDRPPPDEDATTIADEDTPRD
jgi:hypothetical protein